MPPCVQVCLSRACVALAWPYLCLVGFLHDDYSLMVVLDISETKKSRSLVTVARIKLLGMLMSFQHVSTERVLLEADQAKPILSLADYTA